MELPLGVHCDDCIESMSRLPDECAQIVLCDPPYNIGKDFGNESDRREFTEYIEWCKKWLVEAIRILKQDSTLYVYGYSESLVHLQVLALPTDVKLS
jgi:site-specific DNA-methyltransferase (adenine-specific)